MHIFLYNFIVTSSLNSTLDFGSTVYKLTVLCVNVWLMVNVTNSCGKKIRFTIVKTHLL